MQYEMNVLKVGDRVAGVIVGALRPYRGLVAEISANPDDPYPVRVVFENRSEVGAATFGVAYSEISEINGVAVGD